MPSPPLIQIQIHSTDPQTWFLSLSCVSLGKGEGLYLRKTETNSITAENRGCVPPNWPVRTLSIRHRDGPGGWGGWSREYLLARVAGVHDSCSGTRGEENRPWEGGQKEDGGKPLNLSDQVSWSDQLPVPQFLYLMRRCRLYKLIAL